MSWRWFTGAHVFMAFFCAAWDIFLVFWYAIAFRGHAPGGFSLVMVLFPIAHVAVGVGLTYSTLAGFWNRTTVRVTRERLSIRHGPIPWFGNRVLPSSELRRLHASERPGYRRNNMPVYQLLAVTRRGEEIRLLSVDDPTQAQFLEQRIESFLGITDQSVSGQV